jgi:hypothetical protein
MTGKSTLEPVFNAAAKALMRVVFMVKKIREVAYN